MLQRLTHREWFLQGHKNPNLGYRFDPATGTSRPDITTDYRHLRKPELPPEVKQGVEAIKEKLKGRDPGLIDSAVNTYIQQRMREYGPNPEGLGCALGPEGSAVEVEPGPGPGPEKKKGEAATSKRRAKVRRLNIPPGDVVKEGKRLRLWACWLAIYRQLYRRSRFGNLEDMPHYPRATRRKGRYYFCGNDYLARLCGLGVRTVKEVLHQLEKAGLIYVRYKGYKGRGCSIIELPVNMGLVWKWRREHKGPKPST